MVLVKDNEWETTVRSASRNKQGEYKFFCGNNRIEWYGDNNRDGFAYSDELSNIFFPREPGTYRVRFNDLTQEYRVVKL